MKHIKPIEEFLLEALRDTWGEAIKDKDEFFGLEYSEQLEKKLMGYALKYVLNSDWHPLKQQYFEEYDEDDTIQEGLESYLKDRVRVVLEEVVSFFKSHQKQDIRIYREIEVNQIWLDLFLNKENDEVHLGEYWSWSEEGADVYWGKGGGYRILFEGKVKQTDIKWAQTFISNLNIPEEKEITLYPNTPLELISITIYGEEVDLSNFKNKEIYA